MGKNVQITSARITLLLSCIISFLLLANLTVIYLHYIHGFKYLRGFLHAFYFDSEANFPSLYSASVIALCSLFLLLIARTEPVRRGNQSSYWHFLALVFLFLALDEFTGIHELLIKPAGAIVDSLSIRSSYLYFGWFLPYVFLATLVGFIFLKVFLKLPAKIRVQFVAGGTVFVLGAVGMEMVGGKYWVDSGWNIDGTDPVDIRYALIVTVEELLEMVGMVIFIHGLSGYYFHLIREHRIVLTLTDNGNVMRSTPDEND